MENVNEKHKDTVFTFLFNDPALLRELYSAIEGITLPPDVPIDINTLSDVLFRRQRNDISFLIDNRLIVLIEHQSTINDNMPFRFLMYVEKLYELITDPDDRFRRKLGTIPKPEFIVLYNGMEQYPDYKELRLSDIFAKTYTKIDLPMELVVQVYNINKGRNREILGKSHTLDSYSRFIDKIREYQKEYQWKYPDKDDRKELLDKAFRSAIEYCIKNNILKDFLKKHGSEVLNMLYAEYDPEVEMRVVREEALEEGREVGVLITARNALDEGLSVEMVQKITGLNFDAIERLSQKEVFDEM
jgi:hypothetical protein